MSAFDVLSEHLVTEVPIARLQTLLTEIPVAGVGPSGGAVCGLGCRPGAGMLCGFSCRPHLTAKDVTDPDGRLGLTEKDLTDVRTDLPKLRQAIIYQVESHLGALR